MKITVVTHCWAVKKSLYSVMLRAQLTSLYRNSPDICLRVIVCADRKDSLTVDAISYFKDKGWSSLEVLWMESPMMWRRCIGRNIAALSDTEADLFWFADCDYLAGPGCLDLIIDEWVKAGKPELIWPFHYQANEDKSLVDRLCSDRIGTRGEVTPDLSVFAPMRCNRAIGGVQFVSGAYARSHGYIPHLKKWQTPPSRPFPDTRDDRVFRQKLLLEGRAVRIENVETLYRLRHTEVGYGKAQIQGGV